jgi:hypothetical protein
VSVAPARRSASEHRTIDWRRPGTKAIVHPNMASGTSLPQGFQAASEKERNVFIILFVNALVYEVLKRIFGLLGDEVKAKLK